MDHILHLYMAHMAGIDYYSSSDEDSDFDMVCVNDRGDARSDVSVYGSISSNEGDTQDEFEGDNLGQEESDCNDDTVSMVEDTEEKLHCVSTERESNADENSENPEVQPSQAVHNLVHSCTEDHGNESNPTLPSDVGNDGNCSAVLPSLNNLIVNDAGILRVHYIDFPEAGSEVCPVQPVGHLHCEHNLAAQEQVQSCSDHKSKRSLLVESVKEDDVKRMRSDDRLSAQIIESKAKISDEDSIKPADAHQNHYSNMDSLPDDLILEIFSKLGVNSLINIAPVCKRWYELSKHKSLWAREDIVYDRYHVNQFLRYLRAANYLRTVDVSDLHATHGEILSALLDGTENVRRFSCFCVAHPRVIVELLQRYQYTLEELNISISDERLSYGDGGTFKDGVKPRPGYLLKLISQMKNLKVIRFTGTMPSIGQHQGRVNPKWYFGELENPDLKLHAVSMKFENPREILVNKFIIPFLKSKVLYLKELRLTNDIWQYKEVQDIVQSCDKLEALLRFPMDYLKALENCQQQVFIDFVIGSWIDFPRIQASLVNFSGLSHIQEVSLRFCDNVYFKTDDHVPDTRLKAFLPLLAGRLHSCRRVHIFRWDAASPFVESVHSSNALSKFLTTLSDTLEEVHISDSFRGGRHIPQLMKVIRDSVPHLKSRGIAMNRLGNRGLLFSIRKKKDSVIPNSSLLLLEHGRCELGPY